MGFTLPPKKRRTTGSSTDQESVSDSIKSTTKILPKKTAPKRFKPPKKTRRTTVSSAAPADEENSSDSSTKTKTPTKKYFQKLKPDFKRLPFGLLKTRTKLSMKYWWTDGRRNVPGQIQRKKRENAVWQLLLQRGRMIHLTITW